VPLEVEQDGAKRSPVSSALVEGPPGLDFNITLHAGRYDMDARFLTDLISPSTIKVRAKLNTRRLYGYSEKKLPLYEEDTRSQGLDLGFDEQMILFPFGQNVEDNLRIEISPAMTDHEVYLTSSRFVPPEITFLEKMPGVIHIEAIKVPHRFHVAATLLEDGREIAHGAAEFLLQEKQELPLLAGTGSGDTTAAVAFSIDRYIRGCPAGSAAFSFDIYRPAAAGNTSRQTVASDWAGIHDLGSAAIYDLSGTSMGITTAKRELRFKILAVSGESGY